MSEIPSNWSKVSLADVASWGSGGTPSRKNPEYFVGTIPWLKTGELGEKYVRSTEEHISEAAVQNSAAKLFPKGAVCVAMYGATIGKASILGIEATTNQACAVGVPHSGVLDSEFLYYFLTSEKRGFINAGIGGAQPNISQGLIKSWPIPLPPLAEQKRIVAKIEELFSELEAGEESLRVARRQLGVYRQSLLKQAFEGHLTAQWRAQNPAKLESPAELTDAIQARSRSAKFRAHERHEIPSWAYRTLDELTESVTSGSRGWADYYADSGSIFIRAQNLNQDFLNLADIAYVRLPESAEGKRTRVKFGDLLITITGANTTKAGWVSKELDEAYVSQHVALCRPVSDALSPFLYRYVIAEAGGRKKLTADAYGAGKPGLNLDNVRSLTIPLPSLPEQQEIVRLLDEQFEVIERNEREIDGALRQSEALRQAILQKAFTGRLVPQSPADEPASELLARLRTAKLVHYPEPSEKSELRVAERARRTPRHEN